jgi:hypothetical protein
MGRREQIVDSMIGVIVLVTAAVVMIGIAVPLAIVWLLWKLTLLIPSGRRTHPTQTVHPSTT